ncbi:MAG: hypothetical protein JRG84_02155 [Deltaproteobacteria bacterium]|nr:hypothetical protein [Deltaproteobacteria bacterium]
MQAARFTLWVIWGTLLASVALYAALPLVVAPPGEGMERGAEALQLGLGLVSIASAAASFVLKRILVLAPIARHAIDPCTPAGAQRIQTGYIFAWMLAESIGIYGLVLYFLTTDARTMLPFVAGSALLMLLHAPRAAAITDSQGSHDLAGRPDPIG